MIIEKVVDKDEMIRDIKLFKRQWLLPFKRGLLAFSVIFVGLFILLLFAYIIDGSLTIVYIAIGIVSLYFVLVVARVLIKSNKNIKILINDRTKIYNTRDYIIRKFTFNNNQLVIERNDGTNQVTETFSLDDLYVAWIDKKRTAFILQFKAGKNKKIVAVHSDKIDELEKYFINNNIKYYVVKK